MTDHPCHECDGTGYIAVQRLYVGRTPELSRESCPKCGGSGEASTIETEPALSFLRELTALARNPARRHDRELIELADRVRKHLAR